jgi:hypothetical protein
MGDTIGRDDAMTAFRTARNEFAADPDRLRRMVKVLTKRDREAIVE